MQALRAPTIARASVVRHSLQVASIAQVSRVLAMVEWVDVVWPTSGRCDRLLGHGLLVTVM